MKIGSTLANLLRFQLMSTDDHRKMVSSEIDATENTKQQRIRCPLCGWQPDGKPYWVCEKCLVTFDTFETHAHCPTPGCGNAWTFTQCIACHQKTPHEDWYVEVDG